MQGSVNTVTNFIILIVCQFLNIIQTVLSAAFFQRCLNILTTFSNSIDYSKYVISNLV